MISDYEFYTIQLKQQLSGHITASIPISQNIYKYKQIVKKKKQEMKLTQMPALEKDLEYAQSPLHTTIKKYKCKLLKWKKNKGGVGGTLIRNIKNCDHYLSIVLQISSNFTNNHIEKN